MKNKVHIQIKGEAGRPLKYQNLPGRKIRRPQNFVVFVSEILFFLVEIKLLVLFLQRLYNIPKPY
uniref:Uncharacterized protein n=1 Tax=Meloidogyne enterolobii TaxID=390850 RepID=A0A6V7WUC2_MELEN|nr:unnamed protein product [Meloidogyne enterolobii]